MFHGPWAESPNYALSQGAIVCGDNASAPRPAQSPLPMFAHMRSPDACNLPAIVFMSGASAIAPSRRTTRPLTITVRTSAAWAL